MGSFLLNSKAYNIKAETELAVILSHFNVSYIYNVIDDKLRDINTNFNSMSTLNLVNSFEDNFKHIKLNYPENAKEIYDVRYTTYCEILNKISSEFKFEFRGLEDMDIYEVTRIIYDFYVASYHPYVVKFLTTFIINEYESLYDALELDMYKREKDVSTIGNKKMFDNIHLAIVCSHIDKVLAYIAEMSFPMENILNIVYDNNYTFISVFNKHVFPLNDFYQSFYCSLLHNPYLISDIIAAVKWDIQKRCINVDINMNF